LGPSRRLECSFDGRFVRGFRVAEIGDKIKGFIASEIMFEDNAGAVADDTPLLGGVMDSLGLMQLVSFLEEEFHVAVDDAEITVDNFKTVADIERLVDQKARQG
jgi:acyl carrier protein